MAGLIALFVALFLWTLLWEGWLSERFGGYVLALLKKLKLKK